MFLSLKSYLQCVYSDAVFAVILHVMQVFAIQLVSYLSLQYALPMALTVAKLAVNVMNTMLGGKADFEALTHCRKLCL